MFDETTHADTLLAPDEPSPVLTRSGAAQSRFLLTVDHAGHRIPRSLRQLGLTEERLTRHIGWDIGILGVSQAMADRLHAPLIAQCYSRLVIDCNRKPGMPTSIPEISEDDVIPGNLGLEAADRALRERTFLAPYHQAIGRALDTHAHTDPILLAMHSFTPCYRNDVRPMAAAVMWGRDDRFGRLVAEELRRLRPDDLIAENVPYAVDMTQDYTVPVHAEGRGIPYLAVEIRQDLISDAHGIAVWADVMADAVQAAATRLPTATV
ncbi:putative N-formylglutamate amidohydrolase [Ameyamaea chiangmaiensis NBRC 103196]|uniref:N-formylglutamate amidohydrolase n=1 Tax=Ameyamaea chiangmaiensis TaxID=442969 RepID=A0A850PCK2_9PROT|nr:N-formylglutamate amidohydrolase [Ameyamaea chiangmaiensis]MBS4075555.1 N-formylglutamate amidohydrolase [Ameyamaea chiangmaiensis]NVN40240.1 N-formylglutamate amidohydrolase [Ameyamaea chiangmaiensis]GBQ69327.1 putative N-formylglutamate amidohydrolase [Ameyamaea chiangmaiensis NBRC 103196]